MRERNKQDSAGRAERRGGRAKAGTASLGMQGKRGKKELCRTAIDDSNDGEKSGCIARIDYDGAAQYDNQGLFFEIHFSRSRQKSATMALSLCRLIGSI
jgi:hypothetical protein